MASSWREIAQNVIRRTDKTISKDTSFKDRMKVIDAAYPFGLRKNHPYKIWLDERKLYQARFDDRPPLGELFEWRTHR